MRLSALLAILITSFLAGVRLYCKRKPATILFETDEE